MSDHFGQRTRCPFSLLLLASLTFCTLLYCRALLAAWADLTESRLAAICLAKPGETSRLMEHLSKLQSEGRLVGARVVKPEELDTWVEQTLRHAGVATTVVRATEPTTGPSVIEIAFDRPIRKAERSAEALRAIEADAACERVFFDRLRQRNAAEFFRRARRLSGALLLIVLVVSLGAATSATVLSLERRTPLSASQPARSQKQRTAWASMRPVVGPLLSGAAAGSLAWIALFAILHLWPVSPFDTVRFIVHLAVLFETILLAGLTGAISEALGRAAAQPT